MSAKRRITAEVEEHIIGAVKAGSDMTLAAAVAGVSRQALYKHLERNPKMKARVDEARDFADEKVVRKLYTEALAGNTTAIIFWLKNRRPDEWRDRKELAGSLTLEALVKESWDGDDDVGAAAEI